MAEATNKIGAAFKNAFPQPEPEPEKMNPGGFAAVIVVLCFVIAVIMLTIKLGLVLFT